MFSGFDQILPSLEALGLWSYWIIGGAALLEAFFITAIFVPGTLVVDTGGIMVQHGLIDYFDLVWFVAIGSFIGGEASYWVGRIGARRLKGNWDPTRWKHFQKAERLFDRHGGMSLIIGRFLGPISGLVPFAAALSGMGRKPFLIWNAISAFPYALAHVSLGYFLGGAITSLGPLATRVALFAVGAALVLALMWYLVVRIERMLPLVLSILKSMLHAIGENEDARDWASRHPRLAALSRSRFNTHKFAGLPATFIGIAFIYVAAIWAGTSFDYISATPVATDTRVAELAHTLWSPQALGFFAHITALGDWSVVGLIFAGTTLALVLRRQYPLALGLAVALTGNLAMTMALKSIFHRPRPELAYFLETSGSFPSGHASISIAFFGMLFYILWRLKVLGPLGAAIFAVTVAFLLGLSRVYLVEHYLSDVLNGYLVGGMWLLIGIAVAEWWRENHAQTTPSVSRNIAAVVLLVALGGAVWANFSYNKAQNIVETDASTQVAPDIPVLFTSSIVPPTTESVTGAPLEPVSLIFVAKDTASFVAAMQNAGWVQADPPGIVSLSRAAWAAWTNQEYTTAPVTPYFWAGQPNDFGFQKPTKDHTIRERHHARFWQTRYVTPTGARIFIGTASFDDGLDWWLIHHIDPNIDAERDQLVSDLRAVGGVTDNQSFQLSTPHLGADVAGDPWFTDGKVEILWLN